MNDSGACFCADEAQTRALGARLGAALGRDTIVYLEGDLGAGKTTLARAMIQARAPGVRVKSPTYTLVESYALAGFTLHHLDLYRIVDAGELEFLGLADLLQDGGSLLVEWPERGASALPAADLVIRLRHHELGRIVEIAARTERGACLAASV